MIHCEAKAEKSLLRIPLLDLKAGFWSRAGTTRADLLKRKFKPKLGDTLIAQVCIDHNIPLHARDIIFRPLLNNRGFKFILTEWGNGRLKALPAPLP